MHDPFEDLLRTDAFFGARAHGVGSIQADDVLYLGSDALRFRARQIDLVDHGKNFQIVIERHVHVGHRLSFHSLSRVDDEQRTLAGRQAARYFVSEIDVPGSVNQIELILFAVLGSVAQADRTGLDGNTALALEVHAVENLIGFLARADRAGEFEQAVGQR